MTKIQQLGLEEICALADLLATRFGEKGRDAILACLKRDTAKLNGRAALIYVRATRILYESAEPLRY